MFHIIIFYCIFWSNKCSLEYLQETFLKILLTRNFWMVVYITNY